MDHNNILCTFSFFTSITVQLRVLKLKYLNYEVYSKILAIRKESGYTRTESEHLCFCPLKGVIDVISKKWTLLIINALGNHERLRFNDLMKELRGISPKTLSDALKCLQTEGLIKRESFAEIPPRVEYSLTNDGTELRKSIMPLLKWAATRNDAGKEKCASTYRGVAAHRVKELTR